MNLVNRKYNTGIHSLYTNSLDTESEDIYLIQCKCKSTQSLDIKMCVRDAHGEFYHPILKSKMNYGIMK